jgi:DHA2 family multidrug resistance protein
VLFGTTVIIPQFLQVGLGYTAERAGMALSPGGFALMVMMPIAGAVTQTKVDPRVLVAVGYAGLAATLIMMTTVYPGIDFRTMVIYRIVQVLPMPFIFIPISTLNYIGVPREKSNQVSGLSNFSRNIGGSIGTSFLSIFQLRQNQTHQNALVAHTTHANANFEAMIAGFKSLFISQGFDAATASRKALAQAYLMVQGQASALSFKNSFFVLAIVILFLIPLPFIMRRPPRGQAALGGMH